MCLTQDISSFLAEPSGAVPKDSKVAAPWTDVQDWRNAVDFDLEACGLAYDGDLLSLDAPEFCEVNFDPYAPDVNTPTETPAASSSSESSDSFVIKADPGHCESDTEDTTTAANSDGLTTQETSTDPYVRLPKWKRRNAEKHLEGERNRRAKRKGKVLTLKQFLPKMKGKITTNDLLNATLAKVREIRAKEVGAKSVIDFREAMRSSRLMATLAVDEFDRVVEASESFCHFIQWPAGQPIVGQHISCFMHHDDAFKLCHAVEQDRQLTKGKPVASQMVGLARFVRSGVAGYSFEAVEMDVSVSERKSVFSFRVPLF